ncbi:MAG: Clp protease/crotonase-like domain-containing protein [Planctomycetota bacterium]|jgi:hypothetical protein
MKRIATSILGLGLAGILASGALAQDHEIRAKDGTRWRGDIADVVKVSFSEQGVPVEVEGSLVKVADLYIVVESTVGGVARNKTIFKGDILSMTVGGDAAKAAAVSVSSKPMKADPAMNDRDRPGVFVLPLEGMVGLEFRHEEMERIAEEADRYGPGQIIVFRVKSGGGAVTEMETIHKTLTEIKKRHRLVAWIEEAISAACATSIHCDEIYFMTEGTAGSMTAFAGTKSWQGEELRRWLENAAMWMEQGGRYPGIARVMIHSPLMLSYDKDEVTGEITWYDDLTGEFVLSRPGENLTFNADNAVHCGFADGIADTPEELAKQLDLPAWHEKSQYGREIAKEWQDSVKRAQERIPLLAQRMGYKNTGTGDAVQILGARVKIYEELISWWNRAPNVMMMNGVPPKETLQRELKELRRQIAQIRKAERG